MKFPQKNLKSILLLKEIPPSRSILQIEHLFEKAV